jgi:predicted exporter
MPTESKGRAIVVWALLMLLAAGQLLFNTAYLSDITAFLPQQSQGGLTQGLKEGPAARLWLLALSGGSADELAQASAQLTQRLRDSGQFTQVQNGKGSIDADTEALFIRYRYLLDERIDASYFSAGSLRNFLYQRLDELNSPLSGFSDHWLPADPTEALPALLQRQQSAANGLMLHHEVWLSSDSTQALIMAESRAPGLELEAQRALQNQMQEWFAPLSQAGRIKLVLSGVPAIALQNSAAIQADAQRLSLLCTLFTVLFLIWIYRSPRRVLLSALPLLGGMLLATAVVSFWFGNVHLITLAFGMTVLGVASDYPNHLFGHMRVGEHPAQTLARIWPTLFLGVLSSLLGYLAMALTEFTGLAQLGVFSVTGLLVAALITATLLPHLDAGVAIPARRPLRVALGRSPAWLKVTALLCVAAAAGYLGMQREIWSDDISRLNPVAKELGEQDQILRGLLGGAESRYMIRVEADTLETVLQSEETLALRLDEAVTAHELGGYIMTAQLLPSKQAQQARQAALPVEITLRSALAQALKGLPFRAQTFEPFVQGVTQSRELEPLSRESFAATPFQTQLESRLFTSGGRVASIVRLQQVADPQGLQQRLQGAALPGVVFIDVKQATDDVVRRFREAAVERILWAVALIVAALWLGLSDWRRLLRVVLPVAGAVMVAAAISLALGGALNLFHLVSLLLVLGINLDYGLFFSRPHEGDDAATFHSVLVCCISTAGVFVILSLSAIPVLQAIGVTVASGVLAAFVLAWIFSRSTTPV